jgi:hypothetical protein
VALTTSVMLIDSAPTGYNDTVLPRLWSRQLGAGMLGRGRRHFRGETLRTTDVLFCGRPSNQSSLWQHAWDVNRPSRIPAGMVERLVGYAQERRRRPEHKTDLDQHIGELMAPLALQMEQLTSIVGVAATAATDELTNRVKPCITYTKTLSVFELLHIALKLLYRLLFCPADIVAKTLNIGGDVARQHEQVGARV